MPRGRHILGMALYRHNSATRRRRKSKIATARGFPLDRTEEHAFFYHWLKTGRHHASIREAAEYSDKLFESTSAPTWVERKYRHSIAKGFETRITPDHRTDYTIHTVYFINCLLNPNYMKWLIYQLKIVRNFPNSHLYIVAIIDNERQQEFTGICGSLYPGATVECFTTQQAGVGEYRGIHKAWSLGQVHKGDDDIILYFHSKDITRVNNPYKGDVAHLTGMIEDIDRVKEVFDVFPDIDKLGCCIGGGGWLWYNFWFVRGSYLHQAVCPRKDVEKRHYYEGWLGGEHPKSMAGSGTAHLCYSIGRATKLGRFRNIGMMWTPHRLAYDSVPTST